MADGSTSARWRSWLAVVAIAFTFAFFILTWQFYGDPIALFISGERWRVVIYFEDEGSRDRLGDRIAELAREIPFSESRRSAAMVVLIPEGEEEAARALEERIRGIGDPGIVEVRAYKGRR